MMTPRILRLVDSWKTQKSAYPENKIYFPQIKKLINCTLKGYIMVKNNFSAKVTLKQYLKYHFLSKDLTKKTLSIELGNYLPFN